MPVLDNKGQRRKNEDDVNYKGSVVYVVFVLFVIRPFIMVVAHLSDSGAFPKPFHPDGALNGWPR
jgi:hypothetical protein